MSFSLDIVIAKMSPEQWTGDKKNRLLRNLYFLLQYDFAVLLVIRFDIKSPLDTEVYKKASSVFIRLIKTRVLVVFRVMWDSSASNFFISYCAVSMKKIFSIWRKTSKEKITKKLEPKLLYRKFYQRWGSHSFLRC